jgi:cathepsin X
MQYSATNLAGEGTCQDIDICRDCVGPAPPITESGMENCRAIINYKRYYVSSFYEFSGVDKMKMELAMNGPISCGIDSTPSFHMYAGGIYSEKLDSIELNHEIAVVGYGVDAATGVEHWIGRNSWGTYWGEQGFFRMQMYTDNLGIESDCTAGTPSFTKAEA